MEPLHVVVTDVLPRPRIEGAEPGATVRCTDGVLGTLDRIEDRGGVRVLRVRGASGAIGVPEGLVRLVRTDGTIELSCGLEAAASFSGRADSYRPATESIRLHEEELVARKELRDEGVVELQTSIEEFPARLEVEAVREEVEIEHRPAGQEISERRGPYEDGECLVAPVYEEQLVVSKRLVLKEELRVRRHPVVRDLAVIEPL